MNDYVSIYTRSQAIEDGNLFDVSQLAREYGFRFPVAMTRAAFHACVAVREDDIGQDETGRTWDVLTCLRVASKQASQQRVVLFRVLVSKGGQPPQAVLLKACCGPGDDGKAVVTIMLSVEN